MSNMNDDSRSALAPANASPRALRRVGIIGATAPGIGIAMDLLDAGVPVTLFELERAALDAVLAPARGDGRRMALLAGTVNFHHLKDCDLVIDTVRTDGAGREGLFRRLDQTARPGAVLMTLGTPEGIDRIARCTRRSGEVLGLQLAGTAAQGPVWELVPGSATTGATLATVIALAGELRKDAVVAGTCQGGAARQREQAGGAWQIGQGQE